MGATPAMPKGFMRTINGLSFRQYSPQTPGLHPLFLLLHGWTGDADSMWVFTSRLPKNAIFVAPRGLYPTPGGGYGWYIHKKEAFPWVDDFQDAMEALLGLVNKENFAHADMTAIHVVGFSQGAALAYALALQYPSKIAKLAGLSGFMPEGAAALARNRPLIGKQVFIAHGAQDDLVPVEKARQAVEIMEQAGAQVSYCEDDVGHKLSANCFRGLEDFFAE